MTIAQDDYNVESMELEVGSGLATNPALYPSSSIDTLQTVEDSIPHAELHHLSGKAGMGSDSEDSESEGLIVQRRAPAAEGQGETAAEAKKSSSAKGKRRAVVEDSEDESGSDMSGPEDAKHAGTAAKSPGQPPATTAPAQSAQNQQVKAPAKAAASAAEKEKPRAQANRKASPVKRPRAVVDGEGEEEEEEEVVVQVGKKQKQSAKRDSKAATAAHAAGESAGEDDGEKDGKQGKGKSSKKTAPSKKQPGSAAKRMLEFVAASMRRSLG